MAPHPVCHNPNTHTVPTGTYGASMWQVRLAPLVLTSTTTCRGVLLGPGIPSRLTLTTVTILIQDRTPARVLPDRKDLSLLIPLKHLSYHP